MTFIFLPVSCWFTATGLCYCSFLSPETELYFCPITFLKAVSVLWAPFFFQNGIFVHFSGLRIADYFHDIKKHFWFLIGWGTQVCVSSHTAVWKWWECCGPVGRHVGCLLQAAGTRPASLLVAFLLFFLIKVLKFNSWGCKAGFSHSPCFERGIFLSGGNRSNFSQVICFA